MKKILIFMLILLFTAVGYLSYAHFSGGKVYTFGLPIGGIKAQVRYRVNNFFEQIKFKNINELKNFTEPFISKEAFFTYLNNILNNPLDQIELENFTINNIELDSTKNRARVKTEFFYKNFITNKSFAQEKLIFLYHANNNWFIDIESVMMHP